MSLRPLYMMSYFIPLLGLYESLPDLIFRRRIDVDIWHPKDVREKHPQELQIRRPILGRDRTI